MSEKLLTIAEAAEKLGAARSTINLWCRSGKLPNAEKKHSPVFGDYWLIPESDIDGIDEIKMGRPKKESE